MEVNCIKMTQRILELTLEIIYLLTGEDNIAVKKTSGDGQNPIMVPLRSLLIPERNNEQKILEVTKRIVDLLMVESGNCRHLKAHIKEDIKEGEDEDSVMREHKCLEGHLSKDISIKNQPALTSPGEINNRRPLERWSSPPHSLESTQEDHTIPHHIQDVEVFDIKTEVKSEEKMYVRDDQLSVKEAEVMVTITKEESSLDNSTDYSKEDNGMVLYAPGIVTQSIHHKLNDMVRLTDWFNFEEFKHSSHTVIPNVQSSFHSTFRSPDPSNPEESSPNNVHPFEDCETSFLQKHDLVAPQRIHTSDKLYSCYMCEKSFIKRSGLVRHHRTHTGEKPFSCSECEKSFNEKSKLFRHHRVHTGEKPFSCSECGKCFSDKGNCEKHMRVHTGEKPFVCPNCNKCFAQKVALIIHQGMHIS